MVNRTEYLHKIIALKCCIESEQLKKDKVTIKLPSANNWDKNMKSILKRIPKKFKFIANMNDSE